MEIIVTIIVTIIAIFLLAQIIAFDSYKRQQAKFNEALRSCVLLLELNDIKLQLRLNNAGTKIIELENAVILPTDKEMN